MTTTDARSHVSIPIFELDSDGSVLPNPIFHRAFDKLHSRCIEYPFAASKVGTSKVILDVGTTKADYIWINWLDHFPGEIHATDYDELTTQVSNITFHRADVRQLDICDNYFEKILAVSVIEHIGLPDSMVNSPAKPVINAHGDEEAFCELIRVLRPKGEIVMTVPFGKDMKLIGGDAARSYNLESIQRFEKYARPVCLDYYEYQFSSMNELYPEYPRQKSFLEQIKHRLIATPSIPRILPDKLPQLAGAVTWRKIPIKNTKSEQLGHVDGVLCGVWRKD